MNFFGRSRNQRSRPSNTIVEKESNPVTRNAPRYSDKSMQQSFAHHSKHHRRARERFIQYAGSSSRLHSLIRENDALRQQLDKQWIDIYNLSEENTKLAAQCAVLREQNRILSANEKMAFKCVHETTKQTKEFRQRARRLSRKNRHLTQEMVKAADAIEQSARKRKTKTQSPQNRPMLQSGQVQLATGDDQQRRNLAVAKLIEPRPKTALDDDPDADVAFDVSEKEDVVD